MKDDQIPVDEEEGREPTREQHEPPRLIELGSYVELTRGGNTGPNPDGVEVSVS